MSTMVWERQRRPWLSRISFASVTPLADFVGRFLRMILLARLLSPVEFGTSVALTVVLATAFLVADIGLDRFVLLNSGEQSRSALAAAHSIQIARGAALALILIMLAGPISGLFDIPQAVASFRWSALLPLVHGFAHLGPKQAKQNYDFRQDALAIMLASATSLAVALPAAWLCRDHNAILYSLVGGELVYVVATHWVADHAYEVSRDREILREALRYGLPLMLNGIGLAVMAQADRFLIGTTLGVETLGVYSVIVSLSIAGMSPFYAICSGLGVSIIARNRSEPLRFEALLMAMIWGFFVFAFSYAAFTGLTLDVLAARLFGQSHGVDQFVRCAIAMIVFVRILRGPASVLFLVDGLTRQLAFANLVAGVGLLCAAVLVRATPTLDAVLAGVLIGDLLSFAAFQVYLARQAPSLGPRMQRVRALELVAAGGLVAALALTDGADAQARVLVALACCLFVAWIARRTATIGLGLRSTTPYAASPCETV